MSFDKYKCTGNARNKTTNKTVYDTLRDLDPDWAVNPELNKSLTHAEVQELMESYHARMSAMSPKVNFMGGFIIDFVKHRLGSTKGKAVFFLHPEDYDNVIKEDE